MTEERKEYLLQQIEEITSRPLELTEDLKYLALTIPTSIESAMRGKESTEKTLMAFILGWKIREHLLEAKKDDFPEFTEKLTGENDESA